MFLIGSIFSGIFIAYFLSSIKIEFKNLIKGQNNDVDISESESSVRERLIESQIRSRSLSIIRESPWSFKFEVLSSRRNYYKRRMTLRGPKIRATFTK